MIRITKLMLTIHRILGSLLSILFLVWFLSGLVMIYHTFPRADRADKRAKMDYLRVADLPSLQTIKDRLPKGEPIKNITLNSYLGQTVFHIRTDKNSYDIPADSTETLPVIDGKRIRETASLWCTAPVEKVDTLYALDQWIPFGNLKKEFPIYKFHFADQERHQLYISSKSGEVLQYTDKDSRLWAWLGAIPHWVYFTSLRQDAELWIKVVVWLSGIGCIMCIAGIYLGVRNFRLARKRKLASPYKKFWYKWHHIIGTVFGLFVLTFTFSGMMSLARVQDWGLRAKLDINPAQELRKLAPSPLDYPLDYRDVIQAYPGQIRQLEWGCFGDIPFYTILTDANDIVVNANSEHTVSPLKLDTEDIHSVLTQVHGTECAMDIRLLEEYDTYYISRKRKLDLPVWKVTIEDIDKSCYYINPGNGQYRYVNTPARWNHWMYPALHSLNIKILVDHPILWNIVMWGLMLGGTFVSLSGVWLGIKFLRRKIHRLTN
ncbi:PepSY domain-containing protein [Parabacteroides sp. HGS0025]|uniref:PepSY domain-containing protein n=1 Tax=Parabacteroides sp. HGS0025 TaxID=1078087 RepID=UPI000617275D|nr:PepSY domain-containing protein [Parabacteroides sp. HGS0025]